MRSSLAIFFLLLLARLASADVIYRGVISSGFIGPTNNVTSPPSSGPGDGYEANLFAYYAMEDADPTLGLHDSLGARDLVYDRGSSASSAGKIGNAFNRNTLEHDFEGPMGSASADFQFHNHSFTIRFWIKTSVSDGGHISFLGFFGTTPNPWEFRIGTRFGSDTDIIFRVNDGGFTVHELTSASGIGDGTYHRVMAWVDDSSHVAGLQIDNDTPITDSLGSNPADFGADYMAIGNLGFDIFIDELAFWDSYALTDSDRLFDWNGGAGIGYPLP